MSCKIGGAPALDKTYPAPALANARDKYPRLKEWSERFAGLSTRRTLPQWRDLPAVREGRVYVPPGLPFGWLDSPPSINRLLGVDWLARVLHPKVFPEPLGPRIKAFHTLYYHREPTELQVRALLDAAGVAK